MARYKIRTKKNACKECKYYHPENKTCQIKKVTTCGNHPYVTWIDRLLCEPQKVREKEDE